MKRNLLLFGLAGVLIFGMTVYAHHSIGATYDGSKEVKLVGKIVEFNYRNPHAFVHIEAPDARAKCSGGPSSGAAPERWANKASREPR